MTNDPVDLETIPGTKTGLLDGMKSVMKVMEHDKLTMTTQKQNDEQQQGFHLVVPMDQKPYGNMKKRSTEQL